MGLDFFVFRTHQAYKEKTNQTPNRVNTSNVPFFKICRIQNLNVKTNFPFSNHQPSNHRKVCAHSPLFHLPEVGI